MSFETLEQLGTRSAVVRVNLLPAEIGQARRSRQVRAGLACGLGVVVAGCVGAYVMTVGHVSAANDALEAEQARTAQLKAAQQPYAEVPKVLAQVATAESVQKTVSASDIPWYSYLDQLAAVSPTGVEFTSVTMATSSSAPETTTADPLQPAGAATVTVVGEATSQDTVASWLDAVARIDNVGTPRLTDSTLDDGTGVYTFTADMTLTGDAIQAKQ